jgi:hypothetical protein
MAARDLDNRRDDRPLIAGFGQSVSFDFSLADRVAALEAELVELRAAMAELRRPKPRRRRVDPVH